MKDSHLFVDTNILIYAHDRSAGAKYIKAKELIKEAWQRPYPPAISTQVLQELYVNLRRKQVEATLAMEVVRNFFRWEVIEGGVALVEAGFQVEAKWKLSFWDSLIVAAALRARATILWSEDLNDGQRFDKLTVFNPLK